MSALVLTEDGSSDAFATVRQLVKHLLQIVDPATDIQHIEFEPATDEHAKAAAVANKWRSSEQRDRRQIVALLRVIAGRLAEAGGFVFFHFDGDTTWSDRDASVTSAQFHSIVDHGVRQTLLMRLAKRRLSESATAEFIGEAMTRLLLVIPHYSVEAWCLQNTMKARELCAKHHGGVHRKVFDDWEADRGHLDEIEKPKEQSCLGAEHNRVLSGVGFPRDEVFKAGKSFAATALVMSERGALTNALTMTHTYPKPESTC
jgi:hypothetical protein